MDKGLYLYCIRAKNSHKFSAKGINGGRVFIIPYKNLETIVSEVSLKEFDSEEIQSKAQEDLKWIAEKAQIHERVIDQAMNKGGETIPVIPMKFGAIFKNKENLLKTVKQHYSEFKKTLDNLSGKEEWGLKVYLIDKERFADEIKREDKEIQKIREEMISKPEGLKYFLEKEIDEKISKKIAEKSDEYIKDIFQILSPFSVREPVINKILPQELAGKGKEMIFNTACLVSKEKVEEFQKAVKRLHKYYYPKGLWLECTGPWPSYNFV